MILIVSMPGGLEWLLILTVIMGPLYAIYQIGKRNGKRAAKHKQMEEDLRELRSRQSN